MRNNYMLRRLHWLLLIGCLELVARPGQAQTPASPAAATDYLVTAAGDTLRGQLVVPRLVTSNGVTLVPAAGGPNRTFRAPECRGFGLADGRRFVVRPIKLTNGLPVPADSATAVADRLPVFMQQLVQGQCDLYRLDFQVRSTTGTAMEYSQYESTFFYVQPTGGSLYLLQQTSFRPVLKSLLQNCPAVQPLVSNVRFDESGLAQLLLRYNTACGTRQPVADLRRRGPSANRFTLGVRAGVYPGRMSYEGNVVIPASKYLTTATLGWSTQYTAGLNLLLGSSTSSLSLSTGVYFTLRRATGTTSLVVSSGYINKGETLDLPQRLEVSSLQVPILAHVRLSPAKTQPFLALGLIAGYSVSNHVTSVQPMDIDVAGSFYPRKVAQQQEFTISKGPLVGGQAGGGIRPRLGTHTLVLEAYAEYGYELADNVVYGHLSYTGVVLRAGIDF